MSPTEFGFAKLISMHDESFFANIAVFNVQSRFTVVLPNCPFWPILRIYRTVITDYEGQLPPSLYIRGINVLKAGLVGYVHAGGRKNS